MSRRYITRKMQCRVCGEGTGLCKYCDQQPSDPTPEQIAERAEAIRAGWPIERLRGQERYKPAIVPQVGPFV